MLPLLFYSYTCLFYLTYISTDGDNDEDFLFPALGGWCCSIVLFVDNLVKKYMPQQTMNMPTLFDAQIGVPKKNDSNATVMGGCAAAKSVTTLLSKCRLA